MISTATLLASGRFRATACILGAVVIASCTVTSGPTLDAATPGYANGAPSLASVLTQAETELSADSDIAAARPADGETPQPAEQAATEAALAAATQPEAAEPVDGDLPTAVAFIAETNPASSAANATARAEPSEKEAPVQVAAVAAPVPSPAVPESGAASDESALDGNAPTGFIENGPGPAPAPQPKKRGFLASLFSSQPEGEPANARKVIELKEPPKAQSRPIATAKAEKPIMTLTSTGGAGSAARPVFSGEALPGVRQDSLFEITRKSGIDDISDIDLHEEDGPVQMASAAGLARLAPNGLIKQTEGVDVGCLKPSLVRVLKTAERHFGKRMVVTSGYRSPERNRRARGAKNSLHMYCAAADVQIPGVSKWELAKFVRSMPGRGGVGTYCHTNSVHIDVGPERDWNWRCRRRG